MRQSLTTSASVSTTNVSASDNLGEETTPDWETQISGLLKDLSSVQADLLVVLEQKRKVLVAGGKEDDLAPLQEQEQLLASRLSECQQRRLEMLAQASEEGRPSSNIQTLAGSLPKKIQARLKPAIRDGRARTRLLQHQSLTNWVLVQRTLLHLSQMVEIIATGGEKSPIYRKSGPSPTSGALMDFDV